MASINIRPTSASFSSSGGNGSITITAENDDWHDEPLSGDIWMAQRKLRSDGTWSEWIIFRIVGEKGEDGSGAVPVFQGVYSPSKSYYGNSSRRDIVKDNNQYWIAKQDAPTSPFSDKEPGTSSGYYYWDSFGASFESVATDLLFAKLTTIEKAIVRYLQTSDSGKRIQIENNVLTMFDSSGKQKLLVTGEDLGALSDSVSSKSFLAGSLTGSQYAINSSAVLLSGSNLNITSVDNTIELPQLSATVNLHPSTSGYSIHAQVYYTIDGVMVASSPSFNGNPMLDEFTLTIPAKKLSLETGTHTLRIVAEVTSDTGYLQNVIYDSGTVGIIYNAEKVQIGANGFRTAFGASNYAEFVDNGSPSFILRAGSYILKVSSSGIQASSDGGSYWRTL